MAKKTLKKMASGHSNKKAIYAAAGANMQSKGKLWKAKDGKRTKSAGHVKRSGGISKKKKKPTRRKEPKKGIAKSTLKFNREHAKIVSPMTREARRIKKMRENITHESQSVDRDQSKLESSFKRQIKKRPVNEVRKELQPKVDGILKRREKIVSETKKIESIVKKSDAKNAPIIKIMERHAENRRKNIKAKKIASKLKGRKPVVNTAQKTLF